MYVSLTRVKTPDQPIENATLVAEEMARWLRDVEGFKGLLVLSKEGSSVGLTFWESREVAERFRPLRRQFLDRITFVADLEIEDIVDYELMFAHLESELTEFSARAGR